MKHAARVLAPMAVALLLAVTPLAASSATVAAAPAMAAAAPTSTQQLDSRLAHLRDQVGEASAEEAALLDQLDASATRKAALDAQVTALDAQIAQAQDALDAAQARVDQAEAQLRATEERLASATLALGKAKDALQARAVAVYIGRPVLSQYADIVLHAQDLGQVAASAGYLNAIVQTQAREVRRYRQLRDTVAELRDIAAAERARAQSERDGVASQRDQLQAARDAQVSLERQVTAEIATRKRLLDQVLARKADFESQLAALQQQSDDLAAVLRRLQAGEVPVVSGHGILAVPIPGAPITSGFGPRVHPIFGDVRMHTGVDFGAAAGTPIHAAADGVVVSAGPLGGYGNATVIDHGHSLATLYAHQSLIIVDPGNHVQRGQVIGFVGCTGLCTGPHLHFEVRVGGTPVDPLPYL